jgi:hypothetical protein
MHGPVLLRCGQVRRCGDALRKGTLLLLVKMNLGSVGDGHLGDDSQAVALSIWRVFHVKKPETAGPCCSQYRLVRAVRYVPTARDWKLPFTFHLCLKSQSGRMRATDYPSLVSLGAEGLGSRGTIHGVCF